MIIRYFCVTTLESPLGHCCPILCPLSSTVDNNYTCVPGMGREKPATGPMAPTKPPAISPAAAAVGLVFAREATAQSGLANLTRSVCFFGL